MQDKRLKIKMFLLPLVLMVGIFALSSIPGRSQGGPWNLLLYVEPHLQNLLHIPLFASLQILWLRAFASIGRHGSPALVACMTITLAYGLADELHQLFVPGRYATLVDVGLNFLGVLLGSILFLWFQKIRSLIQKVSRIS